MLKNCFFYILSYFRRSDKSKRENRNTLRIVRINYYFKTMLTLEKLQTELNQEGISLITASSELKAGLEQTNTDWSAFSLSGTFFGFSGSLSF